VGKQRYEKAMAGMYLGEITRLVLRDMCKEGILFTKAALHILERPGKIFRKYRIESRLFRLKTVFLMKTNFLFKKLENFKNKNRLFQSITDFFIANNSKNYELKIDLLNKKQSF
jgi:hexokinase